MLVLSFTPFLLIVIGLKIGYGTSDNHPANDKALRLLSERINNSRRIDLGDEVAPWDPCKRRVR